jgi:protoporphyrinogen oxidase
VKVAILGAGVTGLTAGYRLGKLGHEVVLYERCPGLGGMAATFDIGDGALLERYYHHLFTTDRHMYELCAEIGLGDELVSRPSSVGMFADGRLYPFTGPLDLLRYKPMSLPARVRLGLGIAYLQRFANDVRPFEQVTIKHWVETRMGRQAWEKVWGPMLRGKFGERADEISMSWLWAKVRARRSATGKEARQELLVYPRRSFEVIFQRLREAIEQQGGRVLIDRPAARLERAGDGGFLVHPGGPDSFRRGHDPRSFEVAGPPDRYQAVIATLPSDIFEQVLDEDLMAAVGNEWLRMARSIEYYAALCLVLELDKQFHPYYWTNAADDEIPFLGAIEHTNLVPPDHYGGRHFLYVPNYLARDHELLSMDMDELLDIYEPGLRKISPGFSRDWIRQSWLFREPAAQQVVLPNYPDRMPPFETEVPGLLMANITQVYPEDRGTNYAVREGEEVTRALLAQEARLAS